MSGKTTLLAYVDESGDTGRGQGSTASYALGCVVVRADEWRYAFDEIIEFRRRIRDHFGIGVRAELKANYLIRSSGPLKGMTLSESQRKMIYRAHLRFMSESRFFKAFAVVVHKGEAPAECELLDEAWTPLLQRLERTSRAWANSSVLVIHDEGETQEIRKLARWSRRQLAAGSAYGNGSRPAPFHQLLDDPVPKASHESYFLQCADLVAYAGWRRLYEPSRRVSAIVPQRTWDELGNSILSDVNGVRLVTAPGIVEIYPK